MDNTLIASLNWRYATKEFDTAKKVSAQDLETLLEVLRLTPSSFGLQPWKFIVVTNDKVRSQLKEKAWNQAQITDASHLIVICAQKTLTEDDVSRFISSIAETRSVGEDKLEGYKNMILGFIQGKSDAELQAWNTRQAYIASGFLLEACATMHIDACPMEGFDANAFADILNLDARGVHPVVICPIGYRSSSDAMARAPKVRYAKGDLVVHVD